MQRERRDRLEGKKFKTFFAAYVKLKSRVMKKLIKISTITVLVLSPIFANAKDDQKGLENSSLSGFSISVIDIQHPTCQGMQNGSIEVRAEGGEAPYHYNWNSFPNQYSEKATGLAEGLYFVHVTDAKGNKFYRSVELKAETTSDQVKKETDYSCGAAEKVIELKQTQHNGQCKIWLDGNEIDDFQPESLDVGVYQIEIEDANKCRTKQYIHVYAIQEKDREHFEILILDTSKEQIVQKK